MKLQIKNLKKNVFHLTQLTSANENTRLMTISRETDSRIYCNGDGYTLYTACQFA